MKPTLVEGRKGREYVCYERDLWSPLIIICCGFPLTEFMLLLCFDYAAYARQFISFLRGVEIKAFNP